MNQPDTNPDAVKDGHSVFDFHAFMTSCWECLALTRCVRFVQSFDGENADFCKPCYQAGVPQELGFKLGLFCVDCKEATKEEASHD